MRHYVIDASRRYASPATPRLRRLFDADTQPPCAMFSLRCCRRHDTPPIRRRRRHAAIAVTSRQAIDAAMPLFRFRFSIAPPSFDAIFAAIEMPPPRHHFIASRHFATITPPPPCHFAAITFAITLLLRDARCEDAMRSARAAELRYERAAGALLSGGCDAQRYATEV